jgi:DNA excision repair protein ERCC-2
MEPASLFPYDSLRAEQSALIKDIHKAVATGTCLIAHAPTGLGKTAASLAPALAFAVKHNKTVFFLTSRHTQHAIAVDTLKQIKQKHKAQFTVTDIVGKKNMCARDDVKALYARQFHDYCRALRERDGCEFYRNFRKGTEPSADTRTVLTALNSAPTHAEETVALAKRHAVCPYEVAAIAAQKASVVIADYYYIFNPTVREHFLKRTGKEIAGSIIIVDEAHNLPDRMREMLTDRLTSQMMERSIREAEKWDEPAIQKFLVELRNVLSSLALNGDRMVTRDQLLEPLKAYPMETVLERMGTAAESIREADQQSAIGGVQEFLQAWLHEEEGYARILALRQRNSITLSFQCLDPSVETKQIVESAHSVILMSGTLTPTSMYREILGFPDDTVEKQYRNPMPKENRLPIIVPSVTTKYSSRSPEQFKKIAEICEKAARSIPGNTILFFPSYAILDEVHAILYNSVDKELLKERPAMSKEEKQSLLNEFKQSYFKGAILMAVIGGSFSEGIDLPGHLLQGVVIVGLPLGQPDLHTKSLISYYDTRFKRGWDYGYIYPAFTKALQSAGRCIRSETDRGVILFLDERYTQDRYYSCFPKDLAPKTTTFYEEAIKAFFQK